MHLQLSFPAALKVLFTSISESCLTTWAHSAAKSSVTWAVLISISAPAKKTFNYLTVGVWPEGAFHYSSSSSSPPYNYVLRLPCAAVLFFGKNSIKCVGHSQRIEKSSLWKNSAASHSRKTTFRSKSGPKSSGRGQIIIPTVDQVPNTNGILYALTLDFYRRMSSVVNSLATTSSLPPLSRLLFPKHREKFPAVWLINDA